MRLFIACGLLTLAGCKQTPNTTQCMSMGGPSELVTDAKAFKLDIYPDTVMCDGGNVPAGSLALSSHSFKPGEELKLDVPPGNRTLVLTTYGDEAGTIITGSGCTTTLLKPGAQVCINLTVLPAPDAGVGPDLACGPNCPCSTSPDDCPNGQYCDGTLCQMGCKEPADCVGMGPGSDGGLPRTSCNLTTHQCAECNTSSDCPLGKLCSPAGVCTIGCDAAHACPGQLTCCNSLCVDTTSDAMNCAVCNNPCNGGSCCNSACIDSAGDVNNCGGCGRACSLAGVAGVACAGGLCTSTCSFGNGNCSRPPAPALDDGCETLVNTVNNCGACGARCDPVAGHGVPACNLPDMGAASCKWSCNGSFKDCVAAAPDTDGCETDVSGDKLNCGACLNVCAGSGASSTSCIGSVCTPMCDTTHLDCDNDATNNDGCEVTASAAGSCTACGTGCGSLPANGMSWTCTNKSCVLACNATFSVCNGNTCKDLQSDSNNCGVCGRVCSTSGTTSTSCLAGVCTPVCDGTHFNCNTNSTNNDGCEVTASAGGSCTACGVGCGVVPPNGASWTCSSKSCVLACNATFSVCNGNTCKDLQSDAANCGACGNLCDTSNNNGTACSGGNCGNSSCKTNQADCSQTNHNLDECETLALTTAHCGTCAACITPPGPNPGFITGAACPSPPPATQATCAYTCDCGGGNQACVTHDNGYAGEHWYDCTALNTYGSAQAALACATHGTGFCSSPTACQGGGSNAVVCDAATNTGGACDCWNYTGTNVGHLHKSTAGCFCPSGTDPQWH